VEGGIVTDGADEKFGNTLLDVNFIRDGGSSAGNGTRGESHKIVPMEKGKEPLEAVIFSVVLSLVLVRTICSMVFSAPTASPSRMEASPSPWSMTLIRLPSAVTKL